MFSLCFWLRDSMSDSSFPHLIEPLLAMITAPGHGPNSSELVYPYTIPLNMNPATDLPLPSDDYSDMDADDSTIINGPNEFDLHLIAMIDRGILTSETTKEVIATRPLVMQHYNGKQKISTERTSPSPPTSQTPSKRAKNDTHDFQNPL